MGIFDDFLAKPGASMALSQMGLGLLAASQGGRPMGSNRWGPAMRSFGMAGRNMQMAQRTAQMKALYDRKAAELTRADEERKRKQGYARAQEGLMPGYEGMGLFGDTGPASAQTRPLPPAGQDIGSEMPWLQGGANEDIIGGTDAARVFEGKSRQEIQMLSGVPGPMGAMAKAYLADLNRRPNMAKGPQGFQRYVGGDQHGERVFPGVERIPQPSDIGSQAQFRLDDGTMVRGFFDKGERRWKYRGADNKEQTIPFGADKVTPSSTGREKMRPRELMGLRKGMKEAEQGVKQIARYMKNVEKTGGGFEAMAEQWKAKFKVIMPGYELDDKGVAALMQHGQIQGLLGKFRKEIVGGGVMTEQDALRILSALGGEPNITRHPEIVRQLLGDIVRQKIGSYNDVDLPMFNDQARRTKIYKEQKPMTVPSIFGGASGGLPAGVSQAEWDAMPPEDRALFQ